LAPQNLPLPPYFQHVSFDTAWRVPYEQRAREARDWAAQYQLQPATRDTTRLGLLLIDEQNTFCLPDFELYVAGRSGNGAVEDSRRITEFIYHNLGNITRITATMDTHQAQQIFHAVFLVDEQGRHPEPYTLVTAEDFRSGKWRFNPALVDSLQRSEQEANRYLQFYADSLARIQKYDLTIWPYHAMLGGIGHALVSAIEEAIFFHTIARYSQPDLILKGSSPWTEAYSAIGPEITQDLRGEILGQKDDRILHWLSDLEALVIAGQAKSHCVAWTIDDLLKQIQNTNPNLAQKVYLLEDCTSPVVIPGVIDYTEQADQAYERYAQAGMHIVRSTDPIHTWLKSA
jgi:nicotinamidase-related amidase